MFKLIKDYNLLINKLSPLLTEKRKKRIEEVLDQRVAGLQVAIEAPSDPHNALAVVRTAEAMGVYQVHLIATEYCKKKRTTSGSNRWVEIQGHKTLNDFLKKGFLLAGATPRSTMSIDELPVDRPLCLLFGNEYRGLSEEALAACQYTFSIPMYGMVESYNLSVSAALALQSVLARMPRGDLSEEERERLRALMYERTVGEKITSALLPRPLR